jgi:CTP synthase
MNLGVKLIVKWIESTSLEVTDVKDELGDLDGILVPGGFGQRGIAGMIKACEYCRVKRVPFFGICLGMQVAVLEYCRNVIGMSSATSEEFLDCNDQSVHVIKKLKVDNIEMGGSMHLGLHATILRSGTLVQRAYGEYIAFERHRHRYGVYGDMVNVLEEGGIVVSGVDEETGGIET